MEELEMVKMPHHWRNAPRTRSRASVSAVVRAVVPAVVLAAGLSAGFSAPAVADPPEGAHARGGPTPVGVWDGLVEVPDNQHRATFSFAADGRACIAFGGPGEVSGSGVGTWWQTGEDRFSFKILHGVHDPAGTSLGSVEVNQRARLDRDTFTSSGASRIFAPDGSQTGTEVAEVSAIRTSKADPSCG